MRSQQAPFVSAALGIEAPLTKDFDRSSAIVNNRFLGSAPSRPAALISPALAQFRRAVPANTGNER